MDPKVSCCSAVTPIITVETSLHLVRGLPLLSLSSCISKMWMESQAPSFIPFSFSMTISYEGLTFLDKHAACKFIAWTIFVFVFPDVGWGDGLVVVEASVYFEDLVELHFKIPFLRTWIVSLTGFWVVDVRPRRAVRFVISVVLALEVVVAILGISSHN